MSEALCQLSDIEDGGTQGFTATVNGRPQGVIAIRQGDTVKLYVNSCPHIGAPLDFTPGQFLDITKTMIQCATHGALFRIDDGHCVTGPCEGQDLEPIAAEVRDGSVFITNG